MFDYVPQSHEFLLFCIGCVCVLYMGFLACRKWCAIRLFVLAEGLQKGGCGVLEQETVASVMRKQPSSLETDIAYCKESYTGIIGNADIAVALIHHTRYTGALRGGGAAFAGRDLFLLRVEKTEPASLKAAEALRTEFEPALINDENIFFLIETWKQLRRVAEMLREE